MSKPAKKRTAKAPALPELFKNFLGLAQKALTHRVVSTLKRAHATKRFKKDFNENSALARLMRRVWLTAGFKKVINEPGISQHKKLWFSSTAPRLPGLLIGSAPRLPLAEMTVDIMPWANIPNQPNVLLSCGVYILAQLTATDPVEVRDWAEAVMKKHFPTMKHSTDAWEINSEVMAMFLAQFGINCYELTVYDVCPPSGVTTSPALTSSHVVLAEMQFTRELTSWVIFFNGLVYHTHTRTIASELTILNSPIVRKFVLFSESWCHAGRRKVVVSHPQEA